MRNEQFKSYDEAIRFLMYGLAKSGGRVFRGEQGLAKSKRFFDAAGNPHRGLKAIHIAGTSGKGTVAYMIDAILRAHGFSTGLALSPHVYDIRERAQINGRLLSKKKFLELIHDALPAILDRFLASESPTYFQTTTLLAMLAMKKEQVDYAVVETGLGGLYDSTNVLEAADKLCVLTRIGKDHTKILGRSYSAIAAQKAGIVHAKNIVVALKQRSDVNKVFRDHAAQMDADLNFVLPDSGTVIQTQLHNPQLLADFQQENIALAVHALQLVAERDGWKLEQETIVKALDTMHLPGRFDVLRSKNKTVVFDGAHNEQKVISLVVQFQKAFPNQKAAVVLALKQDKDASKILKALGPIAKKVYLTRFLNGQDMAGLSHNPNRLLKIAHKLSLSAAVCESAESALKQAVQSSSHVLVCGSNYLLGELHEKI